MSRSRKNRKDPFKAIRSQLNVEALEARALPSATSTVISGYVYYDANNNGAYDPGEIPIANSTIQLQNSAGTVVGNTTTDNNGFYQFTTDQSVPTISETETKTVTFPSTQTDFNLNGLVDQFDPSLGVLQSVEIQHAGSFTSEIKVENLSTDSGSKITGNVSGVLNLTGPGINDNLNISSPAGSFDAGPYDGTTDFSGKSGTSFGQQTANGNDDITVTDPTALAAFTGTGQVQLNETATATSDATGGGNLEVNVASTANATITVIYHYKAYGPLQPGNYVIEQTAIPAGYIPGKVVGGNGTVYPTSPTAPETIPVTLDSTGISTNNDFGELKSTGISGYVYYDANDNGAFDSGEKGLQGVTMTLTGANGATQTATTDSTGAYSFQTLAPGTYTVTESTEPTGYLLGTDTAGTNGGTVNAASPGENISGITLSSGDSATDYDFGKLLPASLAGNVYVDAKNDGQLDPGDPPIANDTITLSGFDDNGPVSQTTTTASDGSYSFTNLRPGTYAIAQTPPTGYTNGATTVGSQGGTGAANNISSITLDAGVAGTNNNFGELKPNSTPTPLPKDVGPFGMIPILNKNQLLANPTLDNIDPAVLAQAKFVVGTTSTLTGQSPSLATMLTDVQSLHNGTSPAALVNAIYTSAPARTVQLDKLYQSVLGRAPTSAEISAGISQLNSGTNVLTLMQTLYTSTEYQSAHATPASMATALSQSILNQTPGSASEQTLEQSLGTQSLSAVVTNLLNSSGSLSNLIDNEYLQVLRRNASASEIQSWTTQLQAGTTTLDAIAQSLLTSQEFYQLALVNVH